MWSCTLLRLACSVLNQKARRTREQIEKDNACAKAAAIEKKEDRSGVKNKCVIEVEDAREGF